MITECLLTAADFDYIVALNGFNGSKADLLGMNKSALALTTVFIIFIIAAAFIVKKARSKNIKIDISLVLPFIVMMCVVVVVDIYQYWSLSSLKENITTSQEKLNETQKAPDSIEQACATRYKDGTSMIISGDITLKKMPNATESEVITGITSK